MNFRNLSIFLLLTMAIALGLLNVFYPEIYLIKLAQTLIILIIVYVIFRVILEEKLVQRIQDPKQRYLLNKSVLAVYFLLSIFFALVIWVENLQALLVGFGLVAAALTIALQEVARNTVGGLLIVVNGIWNVGDRVEINENDGDVIDIGLLYTTLMETGRWVAGDQPTGRLIVIPNGLVLSSPVKNYTKDFGFIWDEVTIPITYDSDWREARELMMAVIHEEGDVFRYSAESEIPQLERKYFFAQGSMEPGVFMKLTDNWIELALRYVVQVRERRVVRNRVNTAILKGIEASKRVKIASQTIEIVGFPSLSLKRFEGDSGDEIDRSRDRTERKSP